MGPKIGRAKMGRAKILPNWASKERLKGPQGAILGQFWSNLGQNKKCQDWGGAGCRGQNRTQREK